MTKKRGSVAPKERINIRYIPATGDQQEEIELPLKVMVLGEFNSNSDDSETMLEDREVISVNKDNFEKVMSESNLELQASVKNRLVDDEDQEMLVNLKFESIRDFTPDAVAEQVPELKKLVELREALTALKGPLGNIPAFRNKLQDLLSNESSRDKLLSELELMTEDKE